jgi:hypothetical protein
LTEFRARDEEAKSSKRLAEILDSSIDAAQTIALCAQHQVSIPFLRSVTLTNQDCNQKRIVDDILTLSKLDSALLMVTPVAVQPVSSASVWRVDSNVDI